MKCIKFNASDINAKLANVVSVANSKAMIPILRNVLIETFIDSENQPQALLTASDNEVWLSVKVPLIEAPAMSFSCLVDAKDFQQSLRNLDGEQVLISFDEEKSSLRGEYENGYFTLPFFSAEEYPTSDLKQVEYEKVLSSEALLTSLSMVKFAISIDTLRPVLNGAHIDFTNSACVCVATDTHKLAKYSDSSITSENEFGLTLPKRATDVLTTILPTIGGEVTLRYTESAAIVANGEFKLYTRLIKGRYPNYNAVIPQQSEVQAIVPKKELISALKRILPFSSSSELSVLNFSTNELKIKVANIDMSTGAGANIPCESSNEFGIAFNGNDLSVLAQNIKDESISCCFTEKSKAGVFKAQSSDDFVVILMPMVYDE